LRAPRVPRLARRAGALRARGVRVVGGYGGEAVLGTGGAHRFAELKYDAGRIAVGVANGTATTPLQTLHAALAP